MFEIILALYEALLLEPPPSSTKTVIFAFNPPNVLGVQIQIGVDRVVIKELGKLFVSAKALQGKSMETSLEVE